MNELQLKIEALKNKFLVLNYYKSVDVDEGWYQIVIHCDADLSAIDPNYKIVQIKQKFGRLCYYFKTSNPDDFELFAKMSSIVLKYEAIAAVTCEATGKSGVLMKSKSGWYRTLNPGYAANAEHYHTYAICAKGR